MFHSLNVLEGNIDWLTIRSYASLVTHMSANEGGSMKNKLIDVAICSIMSILPGVAFAAESVQTIIKLDLSQDLVTLLEFGVWSAAVFVVLIAGIGIAFFGFDVRKARSSIVDMTSELRSLAAKAKKDQEDTRQLQVELQKSKELFEEFVNKAERRIEELGAQIEAMVDKAIPGQEIDEIPKESAEQRSDADLIREIIRSSTFKWTSISRLIKRTGISREQVMELVRRMPDVEINIGKNTGDQIFRFKEAGEPEREFND